MQREPEKRMSSFDLCELFSVCPDFRSKSSTGKNICLLNDVYRVEELPQYTLHTEESEEFLNLIQKAG